MVGARIPLILVGALRGEMKEVPAKGTTSGVIDGASGRRPSNSRGNMVETRPLVQPRVFVITQNEVMAFPEVVSSMLSIYGHHIYVYLISIPHIHSYH